MDWLRRESAMRPPEKFRTATLFCAADQRYEGRKPEPRAYVQGLDVRTISGRRRDIFLDILFIECNQAVTLRTPVVSAIAMLRQPGFADLRREAGLRQRLELIAGVGARSPLETFS